VKDAEGEESWGSGWKSQKNKLRIGHSFKHNIRLVRNSN